MNIKSKIVATVLSGLAIAGFVATTAFANPQSPNAAGATLAAGATAVAGDSAAATRGGNAGRQAGIAGPANDRQQYLAEALGITQEALQTAQTAVREAAMQQAVKDGLITQAQADAMLNGTGGQRGVRIDLRDAGIDTEALLAKALGISVETLQAAEATAAKAELAQAVADGRMTQAQADLKTAQQALQKYIADKGLFTAAVNSAVKDGVLTQAQADAILGQAKSGGLDGGFGLGGPGGGRGHGGSDGGPQLQGARP